MRVRIVRWVVSDGASVRAGDFICELEADIATQELEADESGILRHLKKEGEVFDLGEPVCRIEK